MEVRFQHAPKRGVRQAPSSIQKFPGFVLDSSRSYANQLFASSVVRFRFSVTWLYDSRYTCPAFLTTNPICLRGGSGTAISCRMVSKRVRMFSSWLRSCVPVRSVCGRVLCAAPASRQTHKGAHDSDVDLRRARAAQYAGEQWPRLLSEGVGQVLGVLPRFKVPDWHLRD